VSVIRGRKPTRTSLTEAACLVDLAVRLMYKTGIEICTPGGIDLLKEMGFSGRFVVESRPFSDR